MSYREERRHTMFIGRYLIHDFGSILWKKRQGTTCSKALAFLVSKVLMKMYVSKSHSLLLMKVFHTISVPSRGSLCNFHRGISKISVINISSYIEVINTALCVVKPDIDNFQIYSQVM